MKTWHRYFRQIDDPTWRRWVEKAAVEERESREERGSDNTGCVIEFLRGRRHLCGVIRHAEKRAHSMRILDQEGKERGVRRDKILDISREKLAPQSRAALVEALGHIARRREIVKNGLDMRTLWETAAESGQEAWTPAQLSQLYFVKACTSDERAGLMRALYEGDWFARQGAFFSPLPGSAIERRQLRQEHSRCRQEQLQEAANWLRQVADGRPGTAPENAPECLLLLEEYVLFGKEGEHAAEAIQLLQMAHLHGEKAVIEIFVKLGHWERDENLELHRNRVPVQFTPEAEEQAENLVWSPAAVGSRRWWRGKVCGWVARGGVCERAFSVRRTLKGYRLGIHLASPALLLPSPGAVEDAALERGASMSLPDRFVGMLPPAVHEAVSLSRTERKPALTIAVDLDRQFLVRRYTIGVRKVQLSSSFSPGDSAEAFDGGEPWQMLGAIADGLSRRRLDAGALILPETRPEIVAVAGRAEMRSREIDREMHLIGRELTILANALCGAFCAAHGVPAIYRVAPPLTQRLVQGESLDPAQVHEQRKSLPRTTLQLQAGRHHGVGWDTYSTVGRPLHRCEDLFMHGQLAAFAASGIPAHSPDALERGVAAAAWAREVGPKVVRGGRRYWLLKYLETRIGEPVEATVVECVGRGMVIELNDCGLKDFVVDERAVWARAGDVILVQIAQVAARRNLVKFDRPRPLQPLDMSEVS